MPQGDAETWTVRLMLLLTFCTGVVDAVGFLGLDRVFVGNMTGNVVILGMAVAGADELPVLGPAGALIGFLLGAATAGRTLRSATPPWCGRVCWLFAVAGATSVLVGVSLTVVDHVTTGVGVAVATVLGAVMGVQAGTARFVAVADVTTVVITSTIAGLAADSSLGSGAARSRPGATRRRVSAISVMLVGAGAGALLLRWHVSAGLVLAGGLTLGVTLVGSRLGHRRRNHDGVPLRIA